MWVVVSALIVAASFLAGLIGARFLPASDKTWDVQIQQDTESLLPFVSTQGGVLLEPTDAFWDAWNARRKLYDAEHLAELRDGLNLYLDFLMAEHADAREVWISGNRDVLSDEARARRKEIRERFGPLADALIEDGERLREQAYVASPEVAGYDPSLPRYDEVKRAVFEAMPELRRRVEALTEPL